jgi:hypothetical protein
MRRNSGEHVCGGRGCGRQQTEGKKRTALWSIAECRKNLRPLSDLVVWWPPLAPRLAAAIEGRVD